MKRGDIFKENVKRNKTQWLFFEQVNNEWPFTNNNNNNNNNNDNNEWPFLTEL